MRDGKVFKLAKSDHDIDELDLSAFDAIVTVAPSIIEPAAVDASVETIKQLGLFDRGGLVNQVSERAVGYAQERGAELVGKRRLPDGTIVNNPNAEWRIDETTRDEINKIITEGLKNNIGRDDIADEIEKSFWFSADRAEMIATTEIAMANGRSNLESFHAARRVGVKVKKSWLPDPDACPICQENGDAGPIDLDDDFPSGDDTVPAHPWCECAILPEVEEEADDDVEQADDPTSELTDSAASNNDEG